jgi:phospholipase/carboxylesterase
VPEPPAGRQLARRAPTAVRRAGSRISAPQYSLAFRRLEPEPARPRRLLLLLHGVGRDERQFAATGAAVDADTLVVLPRAPRTVGGNRLGWFRVAFPDDGPQIVAEEAEQSRQRLLAFVGELQAHHGIAADRTVLAGFSQGGVLAASVALTAPERIAGLAVLGGRILPELEPRIAPAGQLAGLEVLIVHGRGDTTLPPAWAERARELLQGRGLAPELQLQDGGHALDAAMRRALLAWFGAPARRWNR